MKFGKKKAGAIAAGLSLVMALSPVAVPAVALADTTTTPQITKDLKLNNGSTVDATFNFKAEPVQLIVQGDEKTEPVATVPTATVAAVTYDSDATGTDAEKAGSNTKTAAVTFGDFDHAGFYAWEVTEVTSGEGFTSIDGMQYDTTSKYILVADVVNAKDAEGNDTLSASYYFLPGDATTVTGTKEGTPTFTNKYSEEAGNEDPDKKDLTITKKLDGSQADTTKDFQFTVTFTAPEVLPANIADAAAYYAQLGITGDATEVSWNDDHNSVTFKLKGDKTASFTGVIAGTTYDVSETAVAGYEPSWTATENGTAGVTKQSGLLAGEGVNKGTMTNKHQDVTPTGIVINNMPYIVMAGAAGAGVAAYGAAKRKLEK